MTLPQKNKFDIGQAIDSKGNMPSQNFRDFMSKLDALVTAIAAGNGPTLVNATNDANAARAGVAVGQFYRNGSAVMQRQV